jgi:uncharacterized membrane protein YraQ (UPF0718 family)
MSENTSSGISFTGALLLIFITLKLTNIIDWSWWWVLGPIWIPLLLAGLVILIAIIIGIIIELVFKQKNKNTKW